MFGVSFTELLLIGAVALLIVGPQRLPQMLGTLGRWTAKLRRITTEVRHQSGIDDILRKEGVSGGLAELRQLQNVARGGLKSLVASTTALPARPQPARPQGSAAASSTTAGSSTGNAGNVPVLGGEDPYAHVPYDRSREYPSEGCDASGALPDDLWSEPLAPRPSSAPKAEPAKSAPPKANAEPAKAEPPKAESAKVEPAKVEPAKPESSLPESSKAEPSKPESASGP